MKEICKQGINNKKKSLFTVALWYLPRHQKEKQLFAAIAMMSKIDVFYFSNCSP